MIDLSKVVTLDFETYFDSNYTLKKLSTSEYVRDPLFKAQMVGIKIGKRTTKIFGASKVKQAIQSIDWSSHDLLAHNTAFDGLILYERYGVKPRYYYDTLSMARGLHGNEIGAGLEDVSVYYGGGGKIKDTLELTRGVLDWDRELTKKAGIYTTQDVEECFRIFCEMLKDYPQSELDLINLTIRMFCQPKLCIDVPRVQAEYEREKKEREEKLLTVTKDLLFTNQTLLKGAEKKLEGIERDLLIAQRIIGSNERYATLLRNEGVDPPVKLSPAWIKKPPAERTEEGKWIYAFSKDDLDFIALPDDTDILGKGLNLNKKGDVEKLARRQERMQQLVDARLSVKSTSPITRAGRFIKAGENGGKLPAGYAYYRAHTGRFGGSNKLNLQNLPRGGELRKSILAAPGHVLAVCDSGQIEARTNGWLWDQNDMLELFRTGQDVYCNFGSAIYGRTITKEDKTERHVAKTAVLGLGYGMGGPKFQMTLARGAGGMRVNITEAEARSIVTTYRQRHAMIVRGWKICGTIIEDMAAGREGEYKCIQWEKERIWLPNGMCLKYPDLRWKDNEWSYQVKQSRTKLYSSKLDENIVQALARIIVMDQMLAIDKKYPVVMTTHDEVVAMPRTRSADACTRFMAKCMTTPPKWAPDIPLSQEGGWAINYSK